jgi:hypothetical protein
LTLNATPVTQKQIHAVQLSLPFGSSLSSVIRSLLKHVGGSEL